MANKKSKIKQTIDKAKEAYSNIDKQEKEVIKEAGKEVIDLVKKAIENKKETGKFDKSYIVSILAAIISLFSVTYTAIQPDAIAYTDEVTTEIKSTLDSNNIVIDSLKSENNILKLEKDSLDLRLKVYEQAIKIK